MILGALLFLFIVATLELTKLDRRFAGGLILTAIGFIYIGFAAHQPDLLLGNTLQAVLVWLLAYAGIKHRAYYIPLGLFLHAGWDWGYLLLLDGMGGTPPDYEVFCIVVDLLLATYFYYRLPTMKQASFQ